MNKINVNKESDTITRINVGDQEYIIVGTAHVSKESVEEVEKVINDEKPDHICVEIDAGRYKGLTEEKSWKSLDIYQILKQKKGFFLLASLMLSSFQKRMGSGSGMKPGMDMKQAIDSGKDLGIPFSFDDRDIAVTLRRSWAKSGFWGKNKVIISLVSSAFSTEEVSNEEIEELKNASELDGMMESLAKELPAVKEVLVDERDQYLATSIFRRTENKVVAVVGAAHVPGMIKWFEKLEDSGYEEKKFAGDLETISVVPPKGFIGQLSALVIPIIIVGALVGISLLKGGSQGADNFINWIVANFVFSGIGAALAGGHILAILATAISAPFTSLGVPVGAGMIGGMVQALIKKPKVEDLESVSENLNSVKHWYKNRVLRVLLIMVLGSFGSFIGTGVAGASIISSLIEAIRSFLGL